MIIEDWFHSHLTCRSKDWLKQNLADSPKNEGNFIRKAVKVGNLGTYFGKEHTGDEMAKDQNENLVKSKSRHK